MTKPDFTTIPFNASFPAATIGEWQGDLEQATGQPAESFIWETMEQMADREEVAEIMRSAGFSDVRHKIMLGCFSEYEAVR